MNSVHTNNNTSVLYLPNTTCPSKVMTNDFQMAYNNFAYNPTQKTYFAKYQDTKLSRNFAPDYASFGNNNDIKHITQATPKLNKLYDQGVLLAQSENAYMRSKCDADELHKSVKKEHIIESPEIQYRHVPVEKIIEVPEVQEHIVYKEVPVPRYVDKVINEYVPVEVPQDIVRHIPVPIAVTSQFDYMLLQPEPVYETTQMNIYVPRFIEVPIPMEYMDETTIFQANQYIEKIAQLAAQPGPSLQDVEEVAGNIKHKVGLNQNVDNVFYRQMLAASWDQRKLHVDSRKDEKF